MFKALLCIVYWTIKTIGLLHIVLLHLPLQGEDSFSWKEILENKFVQIHISYCTVQFTFKSIATATVLAKGNIDSYITGKVL